MEKSLIEVLHLKQGFGIMDMFCLEFAVLKKGLQMVKIANVSKFPKNVVI